MATTCYLRKLSEIATPDQVSLGTNSANLVGTGVGWATPLPIRTTRGGGVVASANTATVTGTTLGIEVTDGANPLQWISPPIDQDVTISGAITKNLWMSESSMTANVGPQVVIERIDSTGAVASTIANHESGVELALTTRAVNNWATGTVTSTNMLKGDRIRIRVAGNDGGGTMATGFSFNLGYAGTTAAADGDSYVQFTETFGFLTTDPTTATLYPTTTASDIDPGGAGTDTFEAWTSRGAGAAQAVTAAAAGWTARVRATVSSGGNFIEWYTKPITAFTLSAPVLVNMWSRDSTGGSHAAPACEMAVTAGDGSSPVVWAAASHPASVTAASSVVTFYLAGDDVAVTDGQRLRVRLLFDDASTTAMAAGANLFHFYAQNTPGFSGDTYLTFGQSLTEYVATTGSLLFKRKNIDLPSRDFDPWSTTGWR